MAGKSKKHICADCIYHQCDNICTSIKNHCTGKCNLTGEKVDCYNYRSKCKNYTPIDWKNSICQKF